MADISHILGLRLSVCNNSRAGGDRICNAWQIKGFTVEAYQLGQFTRRFVRTPISTGGSLHLRCNSVNTVSLLSCLPAWQVYCIENNLHLLGDNIRVTTPYFLRPKDFRNKNMSWRIKHSFYSRHFLFYARLFARSLKIVSLGVSTICICSNQGRLSKNVIR